MDVLVSVGRCRSRSDGVRRRSDVDAADDLVGSLANTVHHLRSPYSPYAYALRVLRKHALCDDSLHDVFRAVAVAKLMYASNAWWGFSNANDRQKIFAFIRRCIRTGFCSPDLADFHDLYISSDEKSLKKILTCPNHILRTYCNYVNPACIAAIPNKRFSFSFSLLHLLHKITVLEIDLTIDSYLTAFLFSRITDCSFIVRMLYRNMY